MQILPDYHTECTSFLSNSCASGLQCFPRAMKEYDRCTNNSGYLLVNLLKATAIWIVVIYVGYNHWGSVMNVIGSQKESVVMSTLATNTLTVLTFILAFMFSANVKKYVDAHAAWSNCCTDLRKLALLLMALEENPTATRDVLANGYLLLLLSKFHSVKRRQHHDRLGRIFCGVASEDFAVHNLSAVRKHFYITTRRLLKESGDMGTARDIISNSYNSQYIMCAPSCAKAVTTTAYTMMCVVGMVIASEQDSFRDALVISSITIGIAALPFIVSASVAVGSFSVSFSRTYMQALDDELMETLVAIRDIVSGASPGAVRGCNAYVCLLTKNPGVRSQR